MHNFTNYDTVNSYNGVKIHFEGGKIMRKKILIILFAALLVITSVVMVSGFISKDSPVSAADIKLTDLSIDSVAYVVNKKV